MKPAMPPFSLSVVIPVYSGEHHLRALVEALAGLRDAWAQADAPIALDEAILVDDSAVDGSPALADALAREYPFVSVLHLSRNFGQHAATVAGILHSSGDWVVTMDEDLQHPPSRIPLLLARAVAEGSDVVYARPSGGVHETAVRDLSSRAFKRLTEWATGNPHIRNVNSFRLMRGPVARAAGSVCGHDTFFDVALSWFTRRVGSVGMELKDERTIRGGRSGYRLRSLLSHARRLLLSNHLKILRLGAVFGLIVTALSFAGGLALLFLKLAAPAAIAVQGWTSLVLLISFFGGATMLMLGIVLEFLSVLMLRAHGKPLFFAVDRSGDAALAGFFGETRP